MEEYMDTQEGDFAVGVARVVEMVEIAGKLGMDLGTIRDMLKVYHEQVTVWRTSNDLGDSPTGYDLIGEFFARMLETWDRNQANAALVRLASLLFPGNEKVAKKGARE